MNFKHVMNHRYSTSARSPHRLAAGICTIVILTFALSHAAPSIADEIDDERDCGMLDSVDDLEKRFVAGLRSYRHSLESYRQSLTDS